MEIPEDRDIDTNINIDSVYDREIVN
ncbi:hypothetical protein MTBBW1_850048 [Desulfamplus magnetovallimortis]|uniref:Uncharacterized protein n=1 Tax=Desulfamplus magnetovallimortis TaxID=1246637 RepID=A0A1W1HKS1_9BACT|nr:hypothetical protein MTBBW1_850048 [Desulfamplus magnetovallimortis]